MNMQRLALLLLILVAAIASMKSEREDEKKAMIASPQSPWPKFEKSWTTEDSIRLDQVTAVMKTLEGMERENGCKMVLTQSKTHWVTICQ